MIINQGGQSKKKIEAIPSQSGTLTYNGNTQTPVWNNYDPEQLTITGTTSAVDAGTYTVAFTPTSRYKWSDGSTAAKTVTWTIGKQTLSAVPSQSGTLTYTGSSQTPSWSNYNSNQLTIGGTTTGTNAGSYTATFTPKSNYKWPDGTTTAKSVTWTVAKAAGSLSLSASSGTIRCVNRTTSFTVTRSGDGAISAVSSNTAVATVSVSGTTVTVKCVKAGSATITVSVAAGTNHTAPTSKTYAVTTQSYLYYSGDECSEVTGGWTGKGWAFTSAVSSATPSITRASSYIQMKIKESVLRCSVALHTASKVNLSNASTLTFNGFIHPIDTSASKKAYGYLYIWSSTSGSTYDGSYVAKKEISNSGSASTISIDVSGLSGSYYIGCGLYNYDTRDAYLRMNSLRLT